MPEDIHPDTKTLDQQPKPKERVWDERAQLEMRLRAYGINNALRWLTERELLR